MPLWKERDTTLDDVEVLGTWNFTLQGDTPLYWIKSGTLDRYHMRFHVHSLCPSTCGIVIHAEADQAGTDGVSFWIERREAKNQEEKESRRYILSGAGLDSRSIVTRPFPDSGADFTEEVEVLVQGYTGAVFLQNRKITLKFKMKQSRGCIAFYNSSSAKGGSDDVHFSDVRITALRRGPLELQGTLGKRERAIQALDERTDLDEPLENQNTHEPRTEGVASAVSEDLMAGGAADETKKPGDGPHDSRATVSTFAPSVTDGKTVSTMGNTMSQTMGTRTSGSGFGSPKSATWGDVRSGGATPQRGGPRTPSRTRVSPGSSKGATPNRTWGHRSGGGGGGGGPASPAFIRKSNSESALRKSPPSMWGLSPASTHHAAAAGGKGPWVAQNTNAPDKEYKLLQPALKPTSEGTNPRGCADFIRVDR